jgi:uncharacterized protein (TIGR02231 family)
MSTALRISLMACCLFYSFGALNAQTEKKLTHELKRVKVYLNLAEMTHVAKTDLAPGIYDLILPALPFTAIAGSEQVSGTGNGTILSVVMRNTFFEKTKENPRVKAIQDSLKAIELRMQELNAILAAYSSEQELLLKNSEVPSKQNGVLAVTLQQLADLFRTRLRELNLLVLHDKNTLVALQKHKKDFQLTLNDLTNQQPKSTKEAVVSYEALEAGPVTISFTYQTPTAMWSAAYDLRVEKSTGPISLGLKGNITNNTGIDWKGIELTLSSGMPTEGLSIPDLGRWGLWLSRQQSVYRMRKSLSGGESNTTLNADMETSENQDVVNISAERPAMQAESLGLSVITRNKKAINTISDYTTQLQTTLAVEYEVKLKYDIPSDGKPHLVELQKISLPAEYNYYAAPKVDKQVYLLAGISGWEAYSLVPGEANIYFTGSFVGRSFLDPASIEDTLQIALGQDPRISVVREKLKDKSKRQVVGDKVKNNITYQITIRNNKTEAIELKLEDLIPITNMKEIEVEVLEVSSGYHNTETGEVKWNLKLKPGESKVLRLGFEVRYPKDWQIEGL